MTDKRKKRWYGRQPSTWPQKQCDERETRYGGKWCHSTSFLAFHTDFLFEKESYSRFLFPSNRFRVNWLPFDAGFATRRCGKCKELARQRCCFILREKRPAKTSNSHCNVIIYRSFLTGIRHRVFKRRPLNVVNVLGSRWVFAIKCDSIR